MPVLAFIAVVLIATPSLDAHAEVEAGGDTPPVATGRAVRASVAPAIDGRDTDAVWRNAPVMGGFRQFSPAEDAPTEFRTEARAAYDERYLYVFVRAFDPHPDSLVALLSRRDERTASEWLKVVVDSYHDRRTGLQFMVNPAGVKRDASIYSDNIEDATWDGVWDVATRIDSLGWTAEYRIPFSQMRFNENEEHTFGFGIWRDIARRNQRDAWPVFRMSSQSFASQLGDLTGIRGIARARRLEVLPYLVEKNVSERRATGWGRNQQHAVGVDVKAGLGSNLTLDATVNPDFGQVEADPALLNLTAFEVRFEERRPFFQEGVGLFKCGGPCEGTFYTRRVGRTPQLRASAADPAFTSILGAGKLTGRLANSVQVGFVGAVTAREVGAAGTTIEPRTSYLVGRLVRDFRSGRSQLGAQVTSLNRALDVVTAPVLRRSAMMAVVQGFHRVGSGRYEAQAYGGLNRVEGSAAAIALTQLSSVHYYQRPDIGEDYDPARTSLGGSTLAATVRKLAGSVRWEIYTRRATAGLELNDMGFVPTVNDAQVRSQVSFLSRKPGSWYRQTNAFAQYDAHWTVTDGLPSGMNGQLHWSASLLNFWGVALTVELGNLANTHCVSCARGGPAVRQSPRATYRFNLAGDPRRAVEPRLDLRAGSGDGGRSTWQSGAGSVRLRLASRTSFELGASYESRVENAQWVGNYGALLSDTTHYTFGRLAQKTTAMTLRGNFTATPALTFQLYAQPFVSSGAYTNWRELAESKAVRYDARYRTYRGGMSPGGFNVKQFNSTAVMRWEYRPASTLFVVWQQGRAQSGVNDGTFAFSRDYRDLFRTHPNNTLLLKLAYWFNP
jgi:hypothetical protein